MYVFHSAPILDCDEPCKAEETVSSASLLDSHIGASDRLVVFTSATLELNV